MVEKLPQHVECHDGKGINRYKNTNVYLFTILNLTIMLPEHRILFL